MFECASKFCGNFVSHYGQFCDPCQQEQFQDDDEYDEPYEDDPDPWICLFPGKCCMPSPLHHQSECYTAEMAEEMMKEEMAA